MPEASITCPKCAAQFQAADCSAHQRHFHAGVELWTCTGCEFSSPDFAHSLIHALLEGHYCRKTARVTAVIAAFSADTRQPELAVESTTEVTGSALIRNLLGGAESEPQESPQKPEEPSERQLTTDPGTIQCSKCSRVLSTFRGLMSTAKAHVRFCCSIKEFGCSSCDYAAASKSDLLKHIRRMCPKGVLKRVDADECTEAERSGMLECFPSIEYRTRTVHEHSVKLRCAKCSAVIQYSDKNDVTKSTNLHVRSCLKIRPYACSNCDYMSSNRDLVRKHIHCPRSSCSTGAVLLIEKEVSEKAIKVGLLQCFPDNSLRVMELS